MIKASKYEVQTLRACDRLDEWDRFVDESPQGSIFCRSWWLRAVCWDAFEILTLRRGGRTVAGMPMAVSSAVGQRIIHMPELTQVLGILLGPQTKGSYYANLSAEMDVLKKLVGAIPRFGYLNLNFHYNFTNWLPLYWAGYRQTTRYTYMFEDLTDLGKVFSGFAHSKRKNIKKAEKLVTVREDLSPRAFYENHKMTLKKQGADISYTYDLFSRIYDAAYSRRCGKTWYATGNEGALHAAIFVVYDEKSAYYLISTIDPDYANSGSATLLLREAITYVSRYTTRFDFEGSMLEAVEQSFRRFGAKQVPYFNISKDNRSFLARGFIGALHKTRAVLSNLFPSR
jgi:hypothetical protein